MRHSVSTDFQCYQIGNGNHRRILSPVTIVLLLFAILLLQKLFVFVPLLGYGLLRTLLRHVRDQYLIPQMNAHNITYSGRDIRKEITYYDRICDENDISTTDPNDLFVTDDTSIEEAVQHHMTHGFTAFNAVLSESTIRSLREHIVARNKVDKGVPDIISGQNRYSQLLSTTDSESSVAIALEEMAKHKLLTATLERILGKDPALVELTAITSTYGAQDQYWHDDISFYGSALNYVNSFNHMVTIFIPLQDTTQQMGATYACPGTQYCSRGSLLTICNKYGFPLGKLYDHETINAIDSKNMTSSYSAVPYWRAGDALMMSSNSQHRGSAHNDPTGLDRVFFLVSFTSKPIPRAETRMMAWGSTYTLRWDMWGHTLHEITFASKLMKRPWNILRSLGMYKLPGTSWGIDFVEHFSQRYINNDGFNRKDLLTCMSNGGYKPWIPMFLHGDYNNTDIDFIDFLYETQYKCETFLVFLTAFSVVLYIMTSASIIRKILRFSHISERHCSNASVQAMVVLTLLFLTFCVYFIVENLKEWVDHTGWAIDIRSRRRFTSLAQYEELYFECEVLDPDWCFYYSSVNSYDKKLPSNAPISNHSTTYNSLRVGTEQKRIYQTGPTTFPNRNDILIATRFGSKIFGDYVNVIDYHPGNKLFRQLLKNAAGKMTHSPPRVRVHYNSDLQVQVVRFIVTTVMFDNQSRFLHQLPTGAWTVLNFEQALDYTLKELQNEWFSTPVLTLRNDLRHMIRDYKFGVHRSTALVVHHSIPFLHTIDKRLLYSLSTTIASVVRSAMIHEDVKKRPFLIKSGIGRALQSKELTASQFKSRYNVFYNGADDGLKNHRYQSRQRLSGAKSVMTNVGTNTAIEPFMGAWLKEGDDVEIFQRGYWYFARIKYVTAKGYYEIFGNEWEKESFHFHRVRPFKPYVVGEELFINAQIEDDTENGEEVYYYEAFVYLGQISGIHQARSPKTQKLVEGFAVYDVRRQGDVVILP